MKIATAMYSVMLVFVLMLHLNHQTGGTCIVVRK